ncbi:MAG: hypothetical protein Q7W51_02665 [Coriobacteriia bacterium]|nr:hypothetical protein [Coriobacteriia bacterium]
MNTYTGDTDRVPPVGGAPLVTPIGDLRRLDAPQRIATPPTFELVPLASLGMPTWTETPTRPLAATHEQARPSRPAPDYVQPIGPAVRQRPAAAPVANVEGARATVAAPIGVIAGERVRVRGARRVARREARRNAVRVSVPAMLWVLLVAAALGPFVSVPLAVQLIEARGFATVGSNAAADGAVVTTLDEEVTEDPVMPAAVTRSTAPAASMVTTPSPYAAPSAATTETSGELDDTARPRGWQ